jgi:hypothetical protein
MKDIEKKITYKDTEYTVVFNLNVMEELQDKYGSLDAWVELMDGTAKNGEPDLKAIIYGYYVMLNEGIEIDNEENGKDLKPLTEKQVGRILTAVGFEDAQKKLGELMTDSTESNEKNE